METYIALIRKEKKSDFGVDFPDFPGCITAGKTLDEAKDLAGEALQFHIDGMVEDGEAIPAPSSLDVIMADPDNADAAAFLVSVYPLKTKAKRINVTIPEAVLNRVDQFVKNNPVRNRSQFLTEASERFIDSTPRRGGGTVREGAVRREGTVTVHGRARDSSVKDVGRSATVRVGGRREGTVTVHSHSRAGSVKNVGRSGVSGSKRRDVVSKHSGGKSGRVRK